MNHEATARVVINLPRDQVWAQLQDISLAINYVPGITGCEITTEKRQGVGASRRVSKKDGSSMDETVIEWTEGGGFVFRIHDGEKSAPFPFDRAHFRYRIEDAGHNKTAVTTSLLFDLRFGWFGRFLYDRVLYKVIRKTIRDVALSMKRFYETGEPVTPGVLRELRDTAAQEA